MDSSVSQQAYTSMMKFTIDGRPYLKDIHDLFAALIVQIPLDTHRYLFRNYNHTFSSEDAIQALGSLRFSHTLRTPDPNDPSKQLRTTTTTTFNMARDMAKALCQQFQSCRLMENATDSNSRSFRDKGLWQLTPKGLCVLQDFCVRTEADVSSLRKHFSHIEPVQLVRLERQPDDDQLTIGRQNLSVIFRVMMTSLPLEGELESASSASSNGTPVSSSRPKSTSSSSSVSSGSSSSTPSSAAPFAMSSGVPGDSRVQLLSNYLLTISKTSKAAQPKTIKNMRTTFPSQLCCDWLIDYSTVSSRDEAELVCNEFIKYGWIEQQDSKQAAANTFVRAAKTTILVLANKGKQIVAEPDKVEGSTKALVEKGQPRRSQSLRDGDDKPTTLREILQQDPESVVITNTTTTAVEKTQEEAGVAAGGVGAATATPTATAAPSVEDDDSPLHHTLGRTKSRPSSTAVDMTVPAMDPKESNAARLKLILDDPQLRSLFKDFLRANFCEENLDFWIDYTTLRRKCRNQSPALPSQNQKDLLEDAYDIWSTYLAPGASCELNVEHSLRQEMARLVNSMVTVVPTYTPGQIKPTIVISAPSVSQSLRMILKWFDRVDEHICRLMASDSVPKFVKTDKYRKVQDARDREQQRRDSGMGRAENGSNKEDLYFTSVENRA
ncbi:hypothetical protein DFQ28_003340 [Apophysomyces sp. BC1034]|nr:hypothetical protein DFQ30_003038 [Apophysomyces sp. BC1015]KAG0179522.1 hypothetical protein DFQ29_001998 [Apophysomyces sp. BC1021]KAG0189495.1 hypothetical protein DFQ28_003340 [Apophysomyces sp. BC1034]